MKTVRDVIDSGMNPIIIINELPVLPSIIGVCNELRKNKIRYSCVFINKDNADKLVSSAQIKKDIGLPRTRTFFSSIIEDVLELDGIFNEDTVIISDDNIFDLISGYEKFEDCCFYTTLSRSISLAPKRKKGKIEKLNSRVERNSTIYKRWRTSVFERDGYTCALTGKKGGQLEAHHIKRWADFPNLRYSISNGITLSKEAHEMINGKEADYEIIFTQKVKKNTVKKKPTRKKKYKVNLRRKNLRAI